MAPPPPPTVDLDPHFLVHTPGLDLPLCFNYEGRAGVSVRLLHDPQSGEWDAVPHLIVVTVVVVEAELVVIAVNSTFKSSSDFELQVVVHVCF